MSILFVIPPNKLNQGFSQCRPLGVFYLIAALRKQGIKADVLDLERNVFTEKEIIGRVSEAGPKIIGLTATSHTRFGALHLAEFFKTNFPEKHIIAGGPHFSQCAHDTLVHTDALDVVVRGEAEEIVCDLIPALLEGEDLGQIKGISFRKNGAICHNPDAAPPMNLDDLPILTDFDHKDYSDKLLVYTENGKSIPAISIITSRGCPYQCIFCSVKNSGYRVRSAKSVVDEIEMWIEKHPEIKAFNFFDLTFTVNAEHARSICDEIVSRNLNITWWAESRLNIDLSLLDVMKKAGCKAVSVGVESGSPRILKVIKKNINLDSLNDFAKRCDNLGIQVSFFFMLSHPTETMEDLQKTKQMAQTLLASFRCVSDTSAGVTTILPGTELERISRDKGILPSDFSWSLPYCRPENLRASYSEYLPIYLETIPLKRLVKFREEIGALGNIKRKNSSWQLLKWGFRRIFSSDRSVRYKLRVGLHTMKVWLGQHNSLQ
ncbi:MAG TPA: radical SAM protein [Syntrophorhabdaceae bacterium]|nr:radical SAM protein [Syntrophorhabdaceae bacterium]